MHVLNEAFDCAFLRIIEELVPTGGIVDLYLVNAVEKHRWMSWLVTNLRGFHRLFLPQCSFIDVHNQAPTMVLRLSEFWLVVPHFMPQ